MSIKILFYTLIIACFTWSCDNPTQSESATKQTTKKKAPPKRKSDKDDLDKKLLYLNKQNAEPFLKQYFKENTERQFKISTTYGDIYLKIYEDTPLHSGNFLYLVKEKKYYDSTLFYRVSPDFIIQGGDADNDEIQTRRFAIGDYTLSPEFNARHRHVRGAVGMSRNYGNNSAKVSTAFDFYIVVGKKLVPIQLRAVERENGITYSPADFERYQNQGGAAHLDFQHTVFGEVTKGMDVVDKISTLEADSREWPVENVKMAIELVE